MPKQYKEIHLKAIKLLKAGMTELKVAEVLGKSRGWVQSIKRDPGYQEAYDKAKITPIEPELQELVKDISREVREPSEVILAKFGMEETRTVDFGMGETRVIDFGERIGILTQAKKIERLRDELENLAQQNITICRIVQNILLERARLLTPEEIPARCLISGLKSIGDTIDQALDMKCQALGIEQLQKVYSDHLSITDAELDTVDI